MLFNCCIKFAGVLFEFGSTAKSMKYGLYSKRSLNSFCVEAKM